jgi:hypothetical protein
VARNRRRPIPTTLAPKQTDLPDDMLRAIGAVVSEWAKVEQSLYIALGLAFGGSPRAEFSESHMLALLLGSGMDNRTMAGLLRSVVQAVYPASADEFAKLIDRVLDEGKRRHIIAHAVWREGSRPGSMKTFSIRAVGEIKYEEHDFTAAEINRLAHRIKAVRLEFIRSMRRHGYFGPLPGKPPSPAPE